MFGIFCFLIFPRNLVCLYLCLYVSLPLVHHIFFRCKIPKQLLPQLQVSSAWLNISLRVQRFSLIGGKTGSQDGPIRRIMFLGSPSVKLEELFLLCVRLILQQITPLSSEAKRISVFCLYTEWAGSFYFKLHLHLAGWCHRETAGSYPPTFQQHIAFCSSTHNANLTSRPYVN